MIRELPICGLDAHLVRFMNGDFGLTVSFGSLLSDKRQEFHPLRLLPGSRARDRPERMNTRRNENFYLSINSNDVES